MKSAATKAFCVSAALVCGVVGGAAQQVPAVGTPDPRTNLKAGLFDAGEATKNMEHIANLPKPDGFFDPTAPAGRGSPPESTQPARGGGPGAGGGGRGRGDGPPPFDPIASNRLGFTNSDLAFSGNHVVVGNYHGFNTYDVERPSKPKLTGSAVCPGGQGDVSIHGNLLFMSVEQTRGRLDCGTQGVPTAVSAERFRGVRIFDITDLSKPRQVAAVQTCRGSHTHTVVTDPKDKANIYIYGSGTGAVRDPEELAGCSGEAPDKNANTALFSIDVIQVPLAAPQNAKIVNRPRIFADPATGDYAGLWKGGDYGPGTQTSRVTSQCHDITVYPDLGLAAGACTGNGILIDISDPVHPVRLDAVADKAFSFWHSATFNNDGTKVLFSDEWGGGGRARCRSIDPPTWGADAIFNIVDHKKLVFAGYYKMPAVQGELENCVAHNGSLVPIPGRDIMVQAWYQGGVSVFDFTDGQRPVEIAYFDRGPIDGKEMHGGGFWSAYYYNGSIFGSEMTRGLDVFKLLPSEYVTQNELDAAALIRYDEMNTQEQKKIVWPATTVVAKAYIDQLKRTNGIAASRASSLISDLERADRLTSGTDRAAGPVLDRLTASAVMLEQDAVAAKTPADAMRLRALEATVKGRVAKLR